MRTSLIAPTVDPVEPPVSIRHIRQTRTNGGQLPITGAGTIVAPVVVIADTTVNNSSIGIILEVK